MARLEPNITVASPSTQLDPSRMVPRETFRSSPYLQRSGTTQPPILVEDIGFRNKFNALEKRVKSIENRITTNPVTINTLANDDWELKHLLNVTVEQRAEDEFIACLCDVDLYGYGETIPDAIDDLKAIIIDQFEYLSERQHTIRLGSMPKKQLEFLKSVLVSTSA